MNIELYTVDYCPYCRKALSFLNEKGVEYVNHDITENEDSLIINGGRKLHGGTVNGCGDHRIVMSAAIAALLTDENVTITDAEAISKSYPEFFTDFAKCGIEILKEQ